MDTLPDRLAKHQLIGLDTAVFIYHLAANPRYLPMTTAVLNAVQTGRCHACTSIITLMELTVLPWRQKRAAVARHYESLLVNFPNLQLLEVNRDITRRAAQLRAQYNFRPADALQIATALVYGATAWVSNDRQHGRIAPLTDVILLDDFLLSEG